MIFEAIQFVAKAHEGHYRKGTNIPYITHLMNVMKSLCELNCREEVIAAGILHDVVEDTPVTLKEVEHRFGPEVADLVAGASEPHKLQENASGDDVESWQERKQHTIDFVAGDATEGKLLVSCADKLDNARSILHDLKKHGDSVWDRFNADQSAQQWYYESLATAFEKRAKELDHPLAHLSGELSKTVTEIFENPNP